MTIDYTGRKQQTSENYSEFCRKIWVTQEHHKLSVGLSVIGLEGEIGEYLAELIMDATPDVILSEAGDIAYYATIIADWLGYNAVELFNFEQFYQGLTMVNSEPVVGLISNPDEYARKVKLASCQVSEPIKKWIRDDKKVDREKVLSSLRRVVFLTTLAHKAVTPTSMIQANYEKLVTRYAHAL